jgi:hypothetical protein
MAATEGFELLPPTEEDLAAAEAAWRAGTIRHDLAKGTAFWRVLRAPSADAALEYSKVCFPSDGLNRFSPVKSGSDIVPAAYAGDSEKVALWEVILRNIRHGGLKRVPRHETRDRYLVQVKTDRALQLLDLRRPAISGVVSPGKRPPDLTAAWPTAYGLTRQWAQALYERIPELDGFIYESHQVPGECIVLFQPKTPEVFVPIEDALPVVADPVRKLLRAEARRAGAAIDFGDLPDPADT